MDTCLKKDYTKCMKYGYETLPKLILISIR